MCPFDCLVHFHLLSSPDIAAYAIPPHLLRERLGALVKKHALALTITESHDAAELAPAMRETTVLVGFNLPTGRVREMARLRWIHLISAGGDHLLPLDWLPAVTLTTRSWRGSTPVARS